ncbi:MAG: phosphoribosylglycinamide formyltransferase [Candidatus Hydrogenedens sp.]|nr:phosphoribosylglycinamide formyltransferase [Candidatus Hydrogenedens sp.]
MALKIAVLLSGNGTTLQNLIDKQAAGMLDASIVCVISSRPDAFGLERARKHDIPAFATQHKFRENPEAFNEEIWSTIREHKAELVVLAGFMCLLQIPKDYTNKIINIHPSLIPAFCGKGMYGDKVHQAVLDYGVKVTGVTVHFVDNEYDQGPIILQEAVPVFDADTPELLAERVQAKEREMYMRAVQLFAKGRVQVDGRKVKIT